MIWTVEITIKWIVSDGREYIELLSGITVHSLYMHEDVFTRQNTLYKGNYTYKISLVFVFYIGTTFSAIWVPSISSTEGKTMAPIFFLSLSLHRCLDGMDKYIWDHLFI